MNRQKIKEIANAVLYEGYLLYPYRASAVKNRQRWNFGVLYPRPFAEAQLGADRWNTQTECLVRPFSLGASLNITVRFLHLIERSDGWQEAIERNVTIEALSISDLASQPRWHAFSYPRSRESDERFVRTRQPVEGVIQVTTQELTHDIFKIRLVVSNTARLDEVGPSERECALAKSLVSAHSIVEVNRGEFVSLLDPPEELREAAAQCQNLGTFPVLTGDDEQRDTMLSSPIILYDYPQIAPESAGPLFDGTEIDEILTLRIMTLSDEEKLEMSRVDDRARQILERTESMPPEQFMKMHGAMRGLRRTGEPT